MAQTTRRHGARVHAEERDRVRVRGDDGDRVGRRHEEAAVEDHVAVAVTGRAKGRHRVRLAVNGHVVGVHAEQVRELVRVGQVRVGVAAAKVLRDGVDKQARGGRTELVAEDAERVRAFDAALVVVEKAKDVAADKVHDCIEVKDRLEQVDVVLGRRPT